MVITNQAATNRSSQSGTRRVYRCKDTNASNYNHSSSHTQDVCKYEQQIDNPNPSDARKKILELQTLLKSLQAQLAATLEPQEDSAYTRDLDITDQGADVLSLQNYLISQGHTIPAGATGYFGEQTRSALAQYQQSAGIAPAAGYFGPITRASVK